MDCLCRLYLLWKLQLTHDLQRAVRVIFITVGFDGGGLHHLFWKAKSQAARTPIGEIQMGVEVFRQYVEGIVLEITPVVGDNRLGGSNVSVAGKPIHRFLLD